MTAESVAFLSSFYAIEFSLSVYSEDAMVSSLLVLLIVIFAA